MLEIRLYKKQGPICLDLDFSVPSPGITVIFGASGAGKTTLINCVAGLSKPDSGRIACRNSVFFDHAHKRCLPPEKRRLGYIFQDGRLFPHLNARQNLMFGPRFRPIPPGSPGLEEVVALLGIGHLLERMPGSLSGGEKQRVALGRALLCSPHLLLMDEPLTALDAPRKLELLDYISRIPQTWGLHILYVTHSVGEMLRLADQVLLLEQGAMIAFGPPDLLTQDPAHASFFPQLINPAKQKGDGYALYDI